MSKILWYSSKVKRGSSSIAVRAWHTLIEKVSKKSKRKTRKWSVVTYLQFPLICCHVNDMMNHYMNVFKHPEASAIAFTTPVFLKECPWQGKQRITEREITTQLESPNREGVLPERRLKEEETWKERRAESGMKAEQREKGGWKKIPPIAGGREGRGRKKKLQERNIQRKERRSRESEWR